MSSIYHKNTRGPKTIPWGTPDSTLLSLDISPSTIAFWVQVVNHVAIHWCVAIRLYAIMCHKSLLWATVSKALEKSSNICNDIQVEQQQDLRLVESFTCSSSVHKLTCKAAKRTFGAQGKVGNEAPTCHWVLQVYSLRTHYEKTSNFEFKTYQKTRGLGLLGISQKTS